MNISIETRDDLSAVITINILKEDYSSRVDKILNDYKKSAKIPGFRKGQVPISIVKKQYGKAVIADEVNKLIKKSLGDYITSEKLDILGSPLPIEQDSMSWDLENFTFLFEIGLSPDFEIKLRRRKSITHYNIIADDKFIQNQLENIQKQYGKLISKNKIDHGDEITGDFTNKEFQINSTTTFNLEKLKGKSNIKRFLGAKKNDVISLKSKNLFSDDNDLVNYLKIDSKKVDELNIDLNFKINEISSREPARLDQNLFDKLFGENKIKSLKELKNRLKEDSEKQFLQHSNQKLLNDATAFLVDNTKFKLPSEFLKKWLRSAGEKTLTEEEAKVEYERSEKSMRYQLIENKLIVENNLKVHLDEIKSFTKQMISSQMMQFNQNIPDDKELEDISKRVLSNKEEVKRISDQLLQNKLLEFYKNNLKLKAKTLSFDAFSKEVYKK